ncbi:MAG TPA: IS630 family transposase [Candidatus Tectomicrobia bacterium]|jgi:transposase
MKPREERKDAVRHGPRDAGYNMSLWTTKVVRHFIYPRFGVEYCRERVRQVLHAPGFRLRRPQHRHLKANPQAQAAFLTELQALVAAWPDEGQLLCVDEATVRHHPTLTAQWCLGEAVPAIPTGDDHTKVQVYGAVVPLTGRTHSWLSPTWSKGACAVFLRQVLRYARPQQVVVIHDRAEQHRGAVVEAGVRDAEGRLLLTPQSAYSPELHPAERIWKWMRRVVTHNHWFETLQEALQAMRDFFCYLAGRKEEVRRLCALKIPESFVALL